LLDATFLREIDEFPDIQGYEFGLDGRRIWLLWSKDGNPHGISLPGTPQSIIDVWGIPVSAPGNSITIDLKPLYLEWKP
jgi:hypothetical protein